MKISEYFNLNKSQAELDFVDIDIDNDIQLFFDPYFISSIETELAGNCNYCIQTFFDSLVVFLHDGDKKNARLLLDHIGEINESHLGYSKGKSAGKGTGSIDKKNLIESILLSDAVKSKMIEKLEDFRLFIENIGNDKISDMCTNITKKYLLEYTEDQCKLWNIPLREAVSGWFWEPDLRIWTQKMCNRLIINDKPYLLIPKNMVSYSQCYSSEKLFSHFVLEYYKNEHLRMQSSLVKTIRDKNGKIISQYVTKKSVKEDFKSKGIIITKEWLLAFCEKHKEVLREFKAKTRLTEKYLTGSVAEIEDINEIIDKLITELDDIKPGKQDAYRYQSLCLSTSELLFYPALANPKSEETINNGTKRIDIIFSNRATNGFFKILKDNDIPCNLITMECKNYSVDLANAEMDQLAGRLTNNRGKFGIQFCRAFQNPNLYLERTQFLARDESKYIIYIDDNRLKQLLNLFRENPVESIYSALLNDWFDEVVKG